MVFQCINIRQVPWEVLKTTAFGLGFQHLPRDLANINAWKPCLIPILENVWMEMILWVYAGWSEFAHFADVQRLFFAWHDPFYYNHYPYHSVSSHLKALLSCFSLTLRDSTKWLTRLTCRWTRTQTNESLTHNCPKIWVNLLNPCHAE